MTDLSHRERELIGAMKQLEKRLRERDEPIAVIGIGCRYPGMRGSGGEALWEMLAAGVDASKEIPPSRVPPSVYSPIVGAERKTYVRRGSFLDDVDSFDANFFSIGSLEAETLDPQQRVLLETTYEALLDAGIDHAREPLTGIYVSAMGIDYAKMLGDLDGEHIAYAGTTVTEFSIPNRISHIFNFRGPSVFVDAACAGSLVATHLACEALRRGECTLAIAGGVQLHLSPDTWVLLSQMRVISPDGRSKSFDAKADGYGRGDGCGVVVLRRLSDALAKGDRILALLRGSATNHAGKTQGLTVPNADTQAAVIRAALKRGAVPPKQVQYIEAHGTGTVLGDPIEVNGLDQVFHDSHTAAQPLRIGSAKTNFGHLEAAAGVAGLTKVILSIAKRQIPPSLHFEEPNPFIPWDDVPVKVQTKLEPWPRPAEPLVAGVSSFGITGTNAHVIVSEAPKPAEVKRSAARALLPLIVTAKTPSAIRAFAASFAAYLDAAKVPREDISFTSAVRRTHLEERLVVFGRTPAEWASQLREVAEGRPPPGVFEGRAPEDPRQLAFVFTGQGPQWWGMGRALLEEEPAFAAAFDRCAAAMKAEGVDPKAELLRDEVSSCLDRTEIAQPTLFALQIALADLLASWGVTPGAVLGHSAGEIAAACVAGALDLEAGARLACVRGRIMGKAADEGAMISVECPPADVEALVAGSAKRIEIGAINTPDSVVLSGDAAAIAEASATLAARGVTVRPIRSRYAFHSHHMARFVDELRAALGGLAAKRGPITMVSTLLGSRSDAPALDADYWARQMRAPVRFADATAALFARGYNTFVEIGPHPVLLASVGRTAAARARQVTLVPTLRRDADQHVSALATLGGLFSAGYPVDWRKYLPPGCQVTVLPTYPWEKRRYWIGDFGVGADETAPSPARSKPEEGAEATELTTRLRALAPAARNKKIEDTILRLLASFLPEGRLAEISVDAGFATLGLESLGAVRLAERLSRELGIELKSTLAFDFPTIARLAAHLGERIGEAGPAARKARQETRKRQPIAVIGSSCRMPGGADGPEAFWKMLVEGRDGIVPVPKDRWDAEAFYDPEPGKIGRSYVKHGGFLTGDVYGFDASFFGISPKEAASMDPQQRLLLELAWEALEDAGLDPQTLHGSRVGVFVGIGQPDFVALVDPLETHIATGLASSVAAGRISFTFGFRGPAIAVDTACSSSLTAIQLAASSLERGECDVALAGGVMLMLSPTSTIAMCQLRALSADGRSKTFDAQADGYGRGEGGGFVVLRRIDDAAADGDRILGKILGVAVNQDGATSGLTVPNGTAQEDVIREALEMAKVRPTEVELLEAHGTGTQLGDPIEVLAAESVLGQGREKGSELALGSVKPNIGHLEHGAGIAGVLKALFSLAHGVIPPHVYSGNGNPNIPWPDTHVEIPTKPRPYQAEAGHRIASVSSFGFSGTNAHVVLGDHLPAEAAAAAATPPFASLDLLVLSASSEASLDGLAERYRERLAASDVPFADLCQATRERRAALRHRLAIVARDAAEAVQALSDVESAVDRRLAFRGQGATRPRTVFVFTGQGTHWFGMGKDLLADPVFLEALRAADAALAPHVGWSVLAEMSAAEEASRLGDVAVVQPLLFAIQVALAALWRSWGLEPDVVVGHSLGEVAAAHVAGALDLANAAKVVATRAKLLARLGGRGAMLAVERTLDEANEDIADLEGKVVVAATNGPRSTVLSGDAAALAALAERLKARGIFQKTVNVDVPYHSPIVGELEGELRAALADLSWNKPSIAFASTALAEPPETIAFDASYWWANMREPVSFVQRIRELVKRPGLFVEISPMPALSLPIDEAIADTPGARGVTIPSMRRGVDGARSMAEALARVWACGGPIDLRRGRATRGRHVALPTYVWDRRVFRGADASALTSNRGHIREFTLAHPQRARGFEGDAMLLLDGAPDAGGLLAAAWRYAGGGQGKRAATELRDVTLQPVGALDGKQVQIVASDARGGSSVYASTLASGDSTWSLALTATAGPRASSKRPSGEPTHELEAPAGRSIQLPAALDEAARHALTIAPPEGLPAARRLGAARRLWASETPLAARVAYWVRQAGAVAVVDLRGFDAGGAVVFEADDLRFEVALDPWLYQATWQPAPATKKSRAKASAISLVVSRDQGGVAERVASVFRERHGLEARIVEPSDLAGFIDKLEGDPNLLLLHLAGASIDGGSATAIDAVTERAFVPAVLAIQACLAKGRRARVWFVTVSAESVHAGADARNPAQSLLGGFAKTLALEHPELWGGSVDLDQTGDEALGWLAATVLGGAPEDTLALRGKDVLVPRLVRASDRAASEVVLDGGSSYIVTDAAGPVGAVVARWASERGAGHLVLVKSAGGSNGAAPHGTATTVVADPATAEGVARIRAAIPPARPLRGVFHAAAVTSQSTILKTTKAEIAESFAIGRAAAVLREAFADADLDFFTAFGTISGTWGSMNQLLAASTSHFLDAFARAGAASGEPIQCLSFGPWTGTGADEAILARLASMGIPAVPASSALELVGRSLGRPPSLSIASIDWTILKPLLEAKVVRPLLATISPEEETSSVPLATQLQPIAAQERLAWLRTEVGGILARVLGLEASQIEHERGFFELGMDSLMALQFTKRLETWSQTKLPSTLAIEHPNVAAATEAVIDRLPEVKSLLAPADELAGMTEEELLAALTEELAS